MRSCILCLHIKTSSLWAEFVNKNRCISVRLVSQEVKSIKFDNFDNLHNSFLWSEYFIDFFMWKMDPMSGCNIRLVFTLPPRDSTLQYKRWVYFWNNFSCITFLSTNKYYLLGMLLPINEYSVHFTLHSTSGLQYTVWGSKSIFCTLYITFYIRPLVHCMRK